EARSALPHERLTPVDDGAAGLARGRDERRLLWAVGEVDDCLAGLELDQHLVAHRRRVDDEVAAGRVRRPVAGTREDPRLRRQRRQERLRGPAGAEQAGAACVDARQDLLVGVETEHAALAQDERVDGVALGLVAGGDDRLLVGDRHIRAGEAERAQRADRRDGILDVAGGVRRVLHARRERVRDRVADERDERRQQPYPCAHSYWAKALSLAVKKWWTLSGLRTK